MNPREKKLLLIVGSLVGAAALLLAVRVVFLGPLRDLDKRISAIRGRMAKAQEERRNFFAAEDKVKNYALRAFADTVDEASAASGELLTRQITQSGLQESDFTRLPAGPRKLRGASEIGWSVQGQGPLPKVVNFLFALRQSPWLHQVEGLSLSPGDAVGTVRVRFRYLTLVIDPAPEVKRKPLPFAVDLTSTQRLVLEPIISRDLLRPYVKRPPVARNRGGSSNAPGAAPGPESLQVVSLSEWNGQPEIHVRDLNSQKTTCFRPGDNIAGASVVMVDYRPMPKPGHSLVQSFSRVILKIGADYFAVERGSKLSEKRKLSPQELPVELAKAQ